MNSMDDLIQIEWPDYNKNRIGQLIICEGGICGKKEKGAFPNPIEKMKEILLAEGLKKYFKITFSPCLGICLPHNVMLAITPKELIWLGMIRDAKPYDELMDWIRSSVKEGKMLPLPASLEKHRFDRFASVK